MLCYSAEENQQEYCHISNVDYHKVELWSVDHWFILSYECLEIVTVSHYIIEVSGIFSVWKGGGKSPLYVIRSTYHACVLFICQTGSGVQTFGVAVDWIQCGYHPHTIIKILIYRFRDYTEKMSTVLRDKTRQEPMTEQDAETSFTGILHST